MAGELSLALGAGSLHGCPGGAAPSPLLPALFPAPSRGLLAGSAAAKPPWPHRPWAGRAGLPPPQDRGREEEKMEEKHGAEGNEAEQTKG